MPDVEFFGQDGSSERDEVLDTARHQLAARWIGVLVVALLAVGAVILAVHEHPDHQLPASVSTRPPPAPATGSSATGAQIAAPVGLLVDLVADPVDHRVIALIGSRLFAFGRGGAVLAASPSLATSSLRNDAVLSYDASDDVVWVVRQGLPMVDPHDPGDAQAFAAGSLRELARIPLPGPSDGSTALSGELYVIASGRLYAARPDAHRFRTVAKVGLNATVPIADPSRHRLLLGLTGGPLQLETLRPGRRPGRPVSLPFGAGEVAVVDGTIWAGGRTRDGAVLTALDPRTLHPGRNIAGRLPVGHSLVLAGTGQHSLFVRPIEGSSSTVLCLDARTGTLRGVLRDAGGLFAVLGSSGYVDRGIGLTPIGTGRCPG